MQTVWLDVSAGGNNIGCHRTPRNMDRGLGSALMALEDSLRVSIVLIYTD